MAWKRRRMPDLTSHNELAVNGVQWGASLRAAGTVSINTQASRSLSARTEYPIENLSPGPNVKRLYHHQKIVLVYSLG